MEKLFQNLTTFSCDELNDILDQRDSKAFDHAWCKLDKLVPEPEARLDTKDVFIKLSGITKGHEICSYISDDLELIYKCETYKVESDFLNYLKNCYLRGTVPSEWHS
ncbi:MULTISPECIES: hypothetical protein [Vibrio]|uniref:Uncharacterized protein n=1 Tax=Vibrio rotiferianus TaxID=190895 RepID=A0A7Y3ZE46_9VIBR|nr:MULTISPECIES: hypothetical protein [Vibrio]HAS6172350.1 hypothetical protein [Vibrio vulnificus]NOH51263.1 hypothetical protein [Vibrio rotiferianus]NOH67091.1 hypothetical protein [Vibrio rotiferianus]USD48719.1 hypothetical protein J4N37_08715 [Vibrio sp. SCSIO 43153]HDY7777620.1 hypothetical protein [Vibrio vulnificus]